MRAASLAGCALALVVSTAARSDTLADAIARAYDTNPNLRAARAVQKQVDEGFVQARSQYGIQVQGSVGRTYERVNGAYFQNDSSPGGAISATTTTAGLQVTQSLYSGGRIRGAVSLAEANILAQREGLRQTEIQVLQQVVNAYLAVRRDLQILEVYRDNVQALDRQLQQVRAQFAVRQVTQTDVDQTVGRLALVRANLANAQAQLEVSRSLYLQAVGDNPGQLDPEPPLDVFPSVDEAFTIAELNNPALNLARYQEQAARARVAQARANFLPNVQAQVAVNQSPIEPYTTALGNQMTVVAGLQATQPLYTSGLYASEVRQAKAQVEEMRARIEAARRTAIQAVSQTWSQMVAARSGLAADEVAATATQSAFYGVRREQPFDLRQPIDVLNAEQELNNAQVRVLQDRYNEYVARVALLAAAGVLGPDTLSPATRPDRPEVHLNKVRNHGLPPYVGVLEAIDSIGAPAPAPPAFAVSTPEGRTAGEPALPAAPPPASQTPPFRTATSIMEAEAKDSAKGGASAASPGRCFDIGGRKIGDCLPQAAPPPSTRAP